MTRRRVLLALLAAAVLGFGSFGIIVWRGTSVTDATAVQARAAFEAERERFAGRPALLNRADDGRLVRRETPATAGVPPVRKLVVMVFRPRDGDLVRGEIPFWFYRLKGIAAALALRGVGYDIHALGLSPGEIRRSGPGLILDEETAAGEAVLIWAE